jgi:hypothetical protein
VKNAGCNDDAHGNGCLSGGGCNATGVAGGHEEPILFSGWIEEQRLTLKEYHILGCRGEVAL